MCAFRLTATSVALFLATTVGASAQDPAKFFEDNCATCHAIGGPPGDAPDLKDITKRRDRAWLVLFILNPVEAAKHDPTAAALVKQYNDAMPPTDGATAQTIDALLHYIETASAAPGPAVRGPVETRQATAADVAAGRELYEGRRALAGRGPSCVGCHRIDSIGGLGGGTLGPDLTRAHQRLARTTGLTRWLGNPPTPVMRAVYRTQPLAEDESFAIAALLADESARPGGTGSARTRNFVGIGGAGALAALMLMALVWSRRMTGVRRPLIERTRTRAGDES